MNNAALAAFGPLLGQLINPGGIYETGAVPQSSPPSSPPVGTPPDAMEETVVQGDPWKPKKRSALGVMGDFMMGFFGAPPVFGQKRREKNIRNAMEPFFADDPIAAFRRLNMIPGMQEKAVQYYDQYKDNERADATQERLLGKDNESKRARAMSILSRVKDDGSNYDVVRSYFNDFVSRNQLDVQPLPEQFDLDFVESAFLSGMNPSQAAMDEVRRVREKRQQVQGDRRLDQGDRRLGQGDRKLDFDEVKEGGRNTRAANAEAGKDRRSKSGGAIDGRAYKDSNGNVVEFNAGGNSMKVTSPSGRVHLFKKGIDGKPVLIRSMSAEEYAKAIEEANKK